MNGALFLFSQQNLPHTSFKADADQLLRLGHEFHRQLLKDVAYETVDDDRDRFLLGKAARAAVEHLVVGNL